MHGSRLRAALALLAPDYAATVTFRVANSGDLAGLRFVDPFLRADPERAESVR
jgi:hypothetical protein